MDTGFSRRTNADRDIQPVAITSVDPVSRMATGITRIRNSIQINCSYAVGDAITVPAVGEQWYVERIDLEWRLYGRIPFNDATLNIEPEEGQVSVGSASGPLELNGTEVRSNGEVFRLNGVYYRDDGETLQRSTDKEVWEPIQAQSAGAIQLIGNALAGVPDPSALVDYLDDLSPEESETLLALAEWASGLSDSIDGIWDVFCENPFFDALRGMGTGDSPVEMAISGFQDLINQLWSALFCGFEGDLTPDTLLSGLQLLTGLFTGNDFVQGLISLVGDSAVGNDLIDAVTGLTDFIQQLLDTFFCDFTGELTPQAILDAITGVLSPLQNNPFVLGLASLSEETGNLLNLAVDGAIGLIDDVFRTLFCDFTGELTPQAIIDHIGTILSPLQSNLFIQGLQTIAETLGVGVGNLAADAVLGVTELVDQIFRLFFCDFTGELTPQALFDKISQVFGPLATNPFLLMLQRIAEAFGIEVNNLISDAIAGATRLLETLLNIVLCRWDQLDIPIINEIIELVDENFSPASILKWVYDLFAPFNDPNSIVGKVIVGLTDLLSRLIQAGLSAAQMTQMGLQDAISGLIEFARVIFDFVTCQMEESDILGLKNFVDALPSMTDFIPAGILKTVFDMLYRVFDNPFFKALKGIAETFGVAVGNFFNDVIIGALALIELIFDIFTCNWDALAPKLQGMLDLIGGIVEDAAFGPANIIKFIVDTFVTPIFDLTQNDFTPIIGAFFNGLRRFTEIALDVQEGSLNLIQGLVRGPAAILDILRKLLFFNPFITEQRADFDAALAKVVEIFQDSVAGNGIIAQILDPLGHIIKALIDNPLTKIAQQVFSFLGIDLGIDFSGNLLAQIVDGIENLFNVAMKIITQTLLPLGDTLWKALLPFIPDSVWDGIDAVEVEIPSPATLGLGLLNAIFKPLETILGLVAGSFTNFFENIKEFFDGMGLFDGNFNLNTAVRYFLTSILGIASEGVGGLLEIGGTLVSNATAALGDFFENIAAFIGIDLRSVRFEDFLSNPLVVFAAFLENIREVLLDWINFYVFGGVRNIGQFLEENIFGPIVQALLSGFPALLDKLGITDIAQAGLGALGDIASNLLTSLTAIPANLLEGLLPPGLLGQIPVSNISNTSPNLINLGSFAEAANIEALNGWSWDSTNNAPGSSGGSAKLVIDQVDNHYLYSRQAVPVASGDRLVLSARVMTSGLTVNPASSTPITISLVPFAGNVQQAAVSIGDKRSGTVGWSTVGNTTAEPYMVTDETWTSVIVRLTVEDTATAGTVWWDEVSLTKTGKLEQDNVTDLTSVWQDIWDSVFPTAGGLVDWTSVADAVSRLLFLGNKGISDAGVADGKAVVADGKAVAADGKAVTADGKAVAADGKAVTADGKAVAAQGAASTADSKAVAADGKAVAADGKAVAADGKAVTADGKAVAAQGAADTADGKAVAAQGAANTADGKAVAAQGAASIADDKAVAADGKAVTADGKAVAADVKAVAADLFATLSSSANNLVLSPDFDNPNIRRHSTPSRWVWEYSSEAYRSSGTSLKVRIASSGQNNIQMILSNIESTGAVTRYPVEPGDQYKYSMWVLGKSTNVGTSYFSLNFNTFGINGGGSSLIAASTTTKGSWQHLSGTFTIPATTGNPASESYQMYPVFFVNLPIINDVYYLDRVLIYRSF